MLWSSAGVPHCTVKCYQWEHVCHIVTVKCFQLVHICQAVSWKHENCYEFISPTVEVAPKWCFGSGGLGRLASPLVPTLQDSSSQFHLTSNYICWLAHCRVISLAKSCIVECNMREYHCLAELVPKSIKERKVPESWKREYKGNEYQWEF